MRFRLPFSRTAPVSVVDPLQRLHEAVAEVNAAAADLPRSLWHLRPFVLSTTSCNGRKGQLVVGFWRPTDGGGVAFEVVPS